MNWQQEHERLMGAMCDLVGVHRGSPNSTINAAVTDATRAEYARLNKLNDEAVHNWEFRKRKEVAENRQSHLPAASSHDATGNENSKRRNL